MAIIENSNSINCNQYRCFSQRLSHEIQMTLGQMPINKYRHKNGKIVNVFVMNPKLSEFLKQWTANRPKEGKTNG